MWSNEISGVYFSSSIFPNWLLPSTWQTRLCLGKMKHSFLVWKNHAKWKPGESTPSKHYIYVLGNMTNFINTFLYHTSLEHISLRKMRLLYNPFIIFQICFWLETKSPNLHRLIFLIEEVELETSTALFQGEEAEVEGCWHWHKPHCWCLSQSHYVCSPLSSADYKQILFPLPASARVLRFEIGSQVSLANSADASLAQQLGQSCTQEKRRRELLSLFCPQAGWETRPTLLH